jgi:hypothetical protein
MLWAAYAVPASATISATTATTIAGDGPLLFEFFIVLLLLPGEWRATLCPDLPPRSEGKPQRALPAIR